MLQVRLGKWSVPSLASALPMSHALLACSIKPYCGPAVAASRLIAHTRRGGVQNDSGMELRPEIMDGISAADPQRGSSEAYRTTRIISRSRKVELSSCQECQTSSAGNIWPVSTVHAFVRNILCVTICGSTNRLLRYKPH